MKAAILITGKNFKPAKESKHRRSLSRLQFLRRFTDDEVEAIYVAAKTSVKLEIWLDQIRMEDEISLDDKQVEKGLMALEERGLLADGRAMEILGKGQARGNGRPGQEVLG